MSEREKNVQVKLSNRWTPLQVCQISVSVQSVLSPGDALIIVGLSSNQKWKTEGIVQMTDDEAALNFVATFGEFLRKG